LLERAECIYLTVVREEDDVSFRAGLRVEQKTEYIERETLEALLEALGVEYTKKCSYCGKVKQLDCFGKRSDGKGKTGYNSRCRICERLRLSRWYPRANRASGKRGEATPEA
jgi:hypothetical protein